MDKEQVGIGYPWTYQMWEDGSRDRQPENVGFSSTIDIDIPSRVLETPRSMEPVSNLRQTRALAWAQRGPIFLGRNQKRYL